jgi:dienelactone hydrolase
MRGQIGLVFAGALLACSTPARSPTSRANGCGEGGPIAQAPGFIRELRCLDITRSDGTRGSLDALVTRPADLGKAPLVVMNHGSPRDAAERAEVSPTNLSGQALAFARRGYAVAAVVRRGFGTTGGAFAESPGPCVNRDYLRASRAAAEDVLGAVDVLKKEPWVDPERIILLGQSAGGMAALASAASNPAGVVAVLSFAGGRGSDAPDHVCQPERLVDSLREMGARSKVPSLWVYAENDHFFGPRLAQQMFDAYRSQAAAGGGAPAEIVMTAPFGADGHKLFSAGSPDLWWPIIAPFLARQRLPTELAHAREPVRLDPPPTLGRAGLDAFAMYLASDGFEKAFAVGQKAWGWSGGRRNAEDAARKAVANCEAHSAERCTVYAINDARAP